MRYNFEMKDGIPLISQFLKQGLSKKTHPYSYNTILNVSKFVENSYLENKKGNISDLQLESILKYAEEKIGKLI